MKRKQVCKSTLKKVLMLVLSFAMAISATGFDTSALTQTSSNVQTAETIELTVGETTTLEATGNKVCWKTSDKNVATITNKGVVTAKKVGTATVTATITTKVKVTTAKTFIGKILQKIFPKVTTTYQKYVINVIEKEPETPPEPVKYTVTFNSNGGSEVESQTVNEGEKVAEPVNPVKESIKFYGWYTDVECKVAYSFDNSIFGDLTLYALWIEDADDDNVNDLVEDEYGTSTSKIDTDDDGLSDYVEIFQTFTNPLLLDSDSNGINDGDEDLDSDGLSNLKELELGTNCTVYDTDGDAISDYDEVLLGTNPLNADTDSDGLLDSEEIKLGLDPLKPKTDGITLDSERKFNQIANDDIIDEALQNSENWLHISVSGNVTGDINNNVFVFESECPELSENRAVISDSVYVDSMYEDEELELNFNYLEDYTSDIFNLSVVKFVDGLMYVVETEIDEETQKIIGKINESGTYCVVDLNVLLKSLGVDVFNNLVYDYSLASIYSIDEIPAEYSATNQNSDGEELIQIDMETLLLSTEQIPMLLSDDNQAVGMADIAFIIDTTGSMSDAIYGVKANIAEFASILTSEYNVEANFALIEYRDISVDGVNSTKLHKNLSSPWFTDVYSFINEVNTLTVDGGGDYPETPIDALEIARNLNWRSETTKFIVVVTDASYKNDNSYGYSNLAQIGDTLYNEGYITSVISPGSSYYSSLTEPCDGLYAYIYSDFYETLLLLAERIARDTNNGDWILLDDFQRIKLSDTIDAISYTDSDNDGLTDGEELISSYKLSLTSFITSLLESHGLSLNDYVGKKEVEVWKYKSNPVLLDTDYDGISDGPIDYDGSSVSKDSSPRNNSNSGTLNNNGYTYSINYKIDYSLLSNTRSTYKDDLSKMGVILSTLAYGSKINITKGKVFSGSCQEMMKSYGLKNVKNYKLSNYYADDDISEIFIGHRQVTYKGVTKEVIIVVVRGTDGTVEEWSSNFDVGSDTSNYWDYSNPEWVDRSHHKGFEVASVRIKKYIDSYISSLSTSSSKVLYFTGHSRGAAIANILASKYVDEGKSAVGYTFATPNTTLKANYCNYNTIYNIVNKDDLVPYLPLESWGFHKYGKTYSISVESKYESKFIIGKDRDKSFEVMFGTDYNYNGNLDKTIKAFEKVVNSRDELYIFDDSANYIYTSITSYNSEESAKTGATNEMKKYGERLSRFAIDKGATGSIHAQSGTIFYRYKINQCPAFLMMVLADLAANEQHINKGTTSDKKVAYTSNGTNEDKLYSLFDIKFAVAPAYKNAKTEFVKSAMDTNEAAATLRLGGMVHGHMPGTYYLLANDSKNLIN